MILVVGATGPLGLGRAIARRLLEDGRPVRALIRSTSDVDSVNELKALGAETIEGDLREPSTLRTACADVDAIVTTATTVMSAQPGDSIRATDHRGQQNLVDAAMNAGVEHFVYVSYSAGLDTASPLTTAKRTVERYLRDSRLTWTILRPTFFMETWLAPAVGFDVARRRATLYGAGDRPISWISLHDVADIAARCVGNAAVANRILELGGPEALSPDDVVAIFEEVAGEPFEIARKPEDELRMQLLESQDPLDASFTALMIDYAKGDVVDTSEALRAFTIPLTSVRDYARLVVRPER
jgi:uncharacterized protein YbjT (DUF2867 family)